MANEPRKILLVKGIAGLANRLLCLVTASVYAELTGRRLVVDWSDSMYSDTGENVFSHLFGGPETLPLDGLGDRQQSVEPPIWRKHLRESAYDVMLGYSGGDSRKSPLFWRAFTADPTRTDLDADVLVVWWYFEQWRLLGRGLRPAGWPAILRHGNRELGRLLRDRIQPSEHIRARIAAFRESNFTGPMIGVHVRHTDLKANLSGILRRVDRLVRENPGHRIFLASDAEKICTLFAGRFPDVVTLPKWYSRSGNALHALRAETPDRRSHAVSAVVDLYLLAACDMLVYDGRSSFGFVASLLNSAPKQYHFDVHRLRIIPRPLRLALWTARSHLRYTPAAVFDPPPSRTLASREG